jgi:hypothetical protein
MSSCQFLSAFGSDFFATRPSRSASLALIPPGKGTRRDRPWMQRGHDGVSLTFVPGS